MLEIKLVTDKEKVSLYSKKNKLVYSQALYLYLGYNGDNLLAAGLFEVGGDEVRAVYYETTQKDDYYLFDAILRAGFNYAGEQGVPMGHLSEEFYITHSAFFDKLNYPTTPKFNIINFFSKYKNCAARQ